MALMSSSMSMVKPKSCLMIYTKRDERDEREGVQDIHRAIDVGVGWGGSNTGKGTRERERDGG